MIHEMGFTPGGEIFVIWLEDRVHIFDLRASSIMQYTVTFSGVPLCNNVRHTVKSFDIVVLTRYQGQDAFLLARGCSESNPLQIFFQPVPNFRSSVPSTPSCLQLSILEISN
ncbi:hypothetical protein DL93DRAFT_2161736 [Clavulina sp. PMI_390]|nr:hypothetical protein DL93DRAFT_2161736 [Clavulina sp. PMI_390]